MPSARLIFRELASVPDVLSTFEQIAHLPYPLLLDSATAESEPVSQDSPSQVVTHIGTPQSRVPTARYSFAMSAPHTVIRATGSHIEQIDCTSGTVVYHTGKALDVIRPFLQEIPASELPPDAPPFVGGVAGYIGYEYGGVLERIPRPHTDDLALPDVVLGVYAWVIAWDHIQHRAWVIGRDAVQVDQIVDQITQTTSTASQQTPTPHQSAQLPPISPPASTFTQSTYITAIERIHDYIRAGDVFQVNLSQRFTAPLTTTPWSLYRRLRTINPAPFAAYFDFGNATLASVSPERFLHTTTNGDVETRPIKGTRPRGVTTAQDAINSTELLQSQKDSAEHIMIVDVLRNDISRVCEYGSVHVPELLALESHPTVHHLVSTVTGHLRPSISAIDLIHACFPGGSITGAPKVRAMEIIAELEPTTRGPYCGTIAYFSATGAIDSSITIRTFVIKDATAYFSAGGGIVADSIPAEEYTETLDKARALIHVL